MKWRSRKWKAAAVAALLLAPPALAEIPAVPAALEAEAAEPQPEPRPALWLLSDADTKIYLFGTFHILPPGFRWRSAAVDGAIRDADELILEVSHRDVLDDPAAVMRQLGLGKSVPLSWRVSPDRREALREMVDASGLPMETFDSMQTWAAVMTIAMMQIVRDFGGDGPQSIAGMAGVEDVLEEEFNRSERPISGVETVAQQIGFFGALSFAEQRGLLEQMIDAYRGGETGNALSERDWVRGDVDAIVIDRDEMPGILYDVLLTHRNRAWTEWLIRRLDRPGTILFAVGAGHLAGPDSVQAMLAGRGFPAQRVE